MKALTKNMLSAVVFTAVGFSSTVACAENSGFDFGLQLLSAVAEGYIEAKEANDPVAQQQRAKRDFERNEREFNRLIKEQDAYFENARRRGYLSD